MHRMYRCSTAIVFALGTTAFAQTDAGLRARPAADPHSTEEWKTVAPHLPDPVTASPAKLEVAGDVLRARRFPEDAITFYKAAIINGGDRSRLLKKEGVVHLEMQNGLISRLCFQQAVKIDKRDAEAWNDLGASDFMLGNTRGAIGEYKRAVKLRKNSAVFHSNLALAYFENKDAQSARKELQRAFTLDPDILRHNENGGYNLQILASTHYADVCFEMARVYAAQGDTETAITWLTKAAERGFDVRAGMKTDPVFAPYLAMERVKTMLANNDHMKSKDVALKGKAPSLGVQ